MNSPLLRRFNHYLSFLVAEAVLLEVAGGEKVQLTPPLLDLAIDTEAEGVLHHLTDEVIVNHYRVLCAIGKLRVPRQGDT